MTRLDWFFGLLLAFVTADALCTNYLAAIYGPEIELNPLMRPFAGTIWLVVIKSGWLILAWVIKWRLVPGQNIDKVKPGHTGNNDHHEKT